MVEAEYIAVMHAAKESIWLHCLTGDILPPSEESMTLYCDNQAVLRLIGGERRWTLHQPFVCHRQDGEPLDSK